MLSDVIVPDIGTVQLEGRILERRPDLPILIYVWLPRDEVVGRGLVLVDAVGRRLDRAAARGGQVTI